LIVILIVDKLTKIRDVYLNGSNLPRICPLIRGSFKKFQILVHLTPNMGRWRGYIIAERAGYRGAMRSPHTRSTKEAAIRDIKRENKEWNSVNQNTQYHKKFKQSFGAYEIPRGETHRFVPGSKGNRQVLKYHDAQKSKKVAKKYGTNFGKVGYNRFTNSY